MNAELMAVGATIISQYVIQARELAKDDPSRALGLVQLAHAADELETARKGVERAARQMHRNAKNRAIYENTHGRFGLEARLIQNPVQALAAAQATPQGRLHLCEIWRSLGKVLLEKDGMNEHEHKLACILLGAPDINLRTSTTRLEFERALKEDRNRKFEVIDERVEKYMAIYLGRMGDEMLRNYCEEGDTQAAMYGTFIHQYDDWVDYVHEHMEEGPEFFYEWKNRPPTGRHYWTSTRKFIAKQLLKYRTMTHDHHDESVKSKPLVVLNAQELKTIETARKSLNQAVANYQKVVAAGKTMGLFTTGGGRMSG